MELTPRFNIPYPDESNESWFATFVSMIEQVDENDFSLFEVRNLVVEGGGVISWAANVLTWASDIELVSPSTGHKTTVVAANITVADGRFLILEVPIAPDDNAAVVFTVADSVTTSDINQKVIAYCDLSGVLHFWHGLTMNDGDVANGIGWGGSGVVLWGLQEVAIDTMLGNRMICGVTSVGAPRLITLPSASLVAGWVYIVKDQGGGAGANNITIATQGAEKIDGADTFVLNQNYASVSLYSNGVHWFVF